MDGNAGEWDDIFTTEEETQELEGEGAGTEGAAEDEIGTTNSAGGDPNSGKDSTAAGDEGGEGGEGGSGEGGLSAELQAIIAAQTQQRVDEFYRQQYAGFISPYTQRPIETEADFKAYTQAFEAEEQQRQLMEMGVDAKMLEEIIGNHPAVKQAQAMMEQQQKAQADAFMQQEFTELQREFPDTGLKDIRELLDSKEGRRALDLWKTAGLTLSEAYAVAYRAKIREKDIAAAKQGVLNQQHGKNHLKQTKGGAAPKPVVTDEVREEFRAFYGEDITDEEIEAKMRR